MDYKILCSQASALADGELPAVSVLSNIASLIFNELSDVSWAGFYLAKAQTLFLGPFCGKVACTVIPFGKGVCGTAASLKESQLVKDVHSFPGHIACDSASESELVIPLLSKEGKVLGVLDLDSTKTARFAQEDLEGLNEIAGLVSKVLESKSLGL